jgi:hypothetical protein
MIASLRAIRGVLYSRTKQLLRLGSVEGFGLYTKLTKSSALVAYSWYIA